MGKASDRDVPPDSRLRELRIRRGLTQAELADLADMHRNSIYKIEKGETREIEAENAESLARVLKVDVDDLGVRIRVAAPPLSVRVRSLTQAQRDLLSEILALPEDSYGPLREAMKHVRAAQQKKKRGKP